MITLALLVVLGPILFQLASNSFMSRPTEAKVNDAFEAAKKGEEYSRRGENEKALKEYRNALRLSKAVLESQAPSVLSDQTYLYNLRGNVDFNIAALVGHADPDTYVQSLRDSVEDSMKSLALARQDLVVSRVLESSAWLAFEYGLRNDLQNSLAWCEFTVREFEELTPGLDPATKGTLRLGAALDALEQKDLTDSQRAKLKELRTRLVVTLQSLVK